MKLIRELQEPVKEITEYFCNKCGLSCRAALPFSNEFNGVIECAVIGGYASTHLDDGDVHEFSLCERCVKDLIDSFKIPSYQGNCQGDPNEIVSEDFKAKYVDKRKFGIYTPEQWEEYQNSLYSKEADNEINELINKAIAEEDAEMNALRSEYEDEEDLDDKPDFDSISLIPKKEEMH